jgi:hypothetical protein
MLNAKFNVFRKKYTVVILNSKWEVLEKNLKVEILPRPKEYIWSGTKYYQVVHVVHNITSTQQISLIVEEIQNVELIVNQVVKK